MLDRLREGLQAAVRKLLGSAAVDEAAVKEFARDLQRTLIQADVNVRQVLEITQRIEKRALQETPPPGLSRKDHIVTILYEEIAHSLGAEESFQPPAARSSVLLLMGIQGSGKTTVAAKLARYLQRRGFRPGVVAADTFRPGALTQLKMLCDPHGIEVFGDEREKQAVDVAARGIRHLRDRAYTAIIVDTAGRHKEEAALLAEMRALSARVHPDYTFLVIDATIGQQAYPQAAAFHEAVPVGGIIVTKLDGAAKGGGALAATAATGAKIVFIGTGERIDDLEPFSPTRFVGRLLGMGDIKTLLEHARELEAEADEKKLQRIMSGKMTIDDLYYQLEQVKRMGSLRKLLELIPGLGSILKETEIEGLEDRMEKWKVLIHSMTREERQSPDIMNASRIRRVARGAGAQDREVKELLARYRQAKAVMKQTKGRGFQQLLRRMSSQ